MFIKGGRHDGRPQCSSAGVDLDQVDDAHKPIVEALSVTHCIAPFTLFSQNAFRLFALEARAKISISSHNIASQSLPIKIKTLYSVSNKKISNVFKKKGVAEGTLGPNIEYLCNIMFPD